jgi:ABC-type methionine transport system permease subunit
MAMLAAPCSVGLFFAAPQKRTFAVILAASLQNACTSTRRTNPFLIALASCVPMYEALSICCCRLCIQVLAIGAIRFSAHPKKPYLCKIEASLLVHSFTLNTQA